jgi:integrase
MSLNITERAVKSLRPVTGRVSIVHYDREVAGFGVCVTASGVRSFVLNYRVDGRERRYTIGRHPAWSADAARKEAKRLRVQVDKGVDPMAEREHRRGEKTVTELATEFMEKHAVKKLREGTVRGYREMLRDHILQAMSRLRLSAVNRRDVEALHNSMSETPYRANRALALISAMFNKGIQWEWCARNPAKGIPHFVEDEREMWLTEEQLGALDGAITRYGRASAEAIRLLILTGARTMEVVGAKWSEFDLVRKVWTRESHQTKEKKKEHIQLSDAAVLVLRRMKAKAVGPYLFPGKKKGCSMKTIRKPWVRTCKAAGLAEEYEVMGKRKMLKRWRPIARVHDLRHSYASWLVSKGAPLPVVGNLLGHVRPDTTARYAHISDQAARDATNTFGAASMKWVS